MDLFFQAEDGIRDDLVTGVQTCALPISPTDLNRLAGRANRNLAAILCLTLRLRPLLPQRCCLLFVVFPVCVTRSEERRVGKECGSRWVPIRDKQKCGGCCAARAFSSPGR